MAVSDLIVRIFGDTKGLERSFARANQATATFGRNVDGVGAKVDKTTKSLRGFATGAATGFAGAFAVTEGIQQIKAAIDVASSLQEQISRSNVTFSTSADVIQDWAKTTASSIGIAEDQALAAASAFGGLFAQSGQSAAAAARLSKSVVTLAADLSSFADTSVDEALTALRSGLSGEIEPLRRFEVFLTEASVAQRAMADTGKDNVKQLTQGEKIMARWNLILEQTTRQQGDVARTSESFANQQRKLASQTRELQGSLGNLLLPAMTKLVANLNEATTGALKLADALRALSQIKIPPIRIPFVFEGQGEGTLGDLAGRVGDSLLRGFETMFPGLKFINDLQDLLNKQADDNAPDVAKALDDAKRRLIEKALGLSAPGGFRDTGPGLAKQFASGISGAIEQAQALAARTIKQGRARIAADKAADAAEKAREAAEIAREKEAARRRAARAREQARQFRALGLAGTGEEIVPGIENLQKRIAGALRRISTGELDVSSKLVERLKLARALIKREGGKVTEDTRRVINDLIRTVTQGTKALEDKGGPLTKTMGLNVQKVLEGLGLTPEVERELRQRLSGINSAGMGKTNTRPTGQFRSSAPPINVNTTVTMDDQVVGRSVTKTQQKDKRRNPKAKRGPRSGI